MKKTTYQKMTNKDKELLDAAEKSIENAYSPYSNFMVGAALLTDNNQIIVGSNVENIAYGATICAERSAISKANTQGLRNFSKIAVIGKGSDKKYNEIVSPCGCCRQVISEFAKISKTNITVIMSNPKKNRVIISTIKELLPLAFK